MHEAVAEIEYHFTFVVEFFFFVVLVGGVVVAFEDLDGEEFGGVFESVEVAAFDGDGFFDVSGEKG